MPVVAKVAPVMSRISVDDHLVGLNSWRGSIQFRCEGRTSPQGQVAGRDDSRAVFPGASVPPPATVTDPRLFHFPPGCTGVRGDRYGRLHTRSHGIAVGVVDQPGSELRFYLLHENDSATSRRIRLMEVSNSSFDRPATV